MLPPPNPCSSRRKQAPSKVRSKKDEGRTELHVIAPATSDDAVHDPSDLNQTASQSHLTSAATNQETQPAWFAESHSGLAPIFNVGCWSSPVELLPLFHGVKDVGCPLARQRSPLARQRSPLARQRSWMFQFNPTSEVETADDADDADKPELGGETVRMSPKPTPQTKPVYHP